MTENKRFKRISVCGDWGIKDMGNDKVLFFGTTEEVETTLDCLNTLHEEKEWLELNNKELVGFIKSKGYTLKDFLDYIGQFASVGVNKEDWE